MKTRLSIPVRWRLLSVVMAMLALTWLFATALFKMTPQQDEPETSTVVTETSAPLAAGSGAGAASVLAQPAAVREVTDIFAVRTWEPPAPPVDPNPPPPQAPALPFKFLGRIIEPGKDMAFMLADGEKVLVVGVGDRIGKDYQLEKYEKGDLLFRYRPMNIRQALSIGGNT
jgi:hypothetical protein